MTYFTGESRKGNGRGDLLERAEAARRRRIEGNHKIRGRPPRRYLNLPDLAGRSNPYGGFSSRDALAFAGYFAKITLGRICIGELFLWFRRYRSLL